MFISFKINVKKCYFLKIFLILGDNVQTVFYNMIEGSSWCKLFIEFILLFKREWLRFGTSYVYRNHRNPYG